PVSSCASSGARYLPSFPTRRSSDLVVTSIYTVMGGIEAVIWTDFFQSFLLWGGGLLCLLVIIYNIDGGLSTIISHAAADKRFILERKSTRLNSSHVKISYAVFCLNN